MRIHTYNVNNRVCRMYAYDPLLAPNGVLTPAVSVTAATPFALRHRDFVRVFRMYAYDLACTQRGGGLSLCRKRTAAPRPSRFLTAVPSVFSEPLVATLTRVLPLFSPLLSRAFEPGVLEYPATWYYLSSLEPRVPRVLEYWVLDQRKTRRWGVGVARPPGFLLVVDLL